MAASRVVIRPVIGIVLVLQRCFVEGVSLTGVKG
jgi:ABC-type glycerol-3-phosphate transport system permease component